MICREKARESAEKDCLLLRGKSAEISYNDAIRKFIKQQTVEKNPHLKPVAAEAFGGRTKILGIEIGDHRDVNKVRA